MKAKQFFFLCSLCSCLYAGAQVMVSPNGKLSLEQKDNKFVLNYQQKPVLNIDKIGIQTTKSSGDLVLDKVTENGSVNADYTMVAGKRLHCTNQANEYTYYYKYSNGKPLQMIVRLYNDGLAFRYVVSQMEQEKLVADHTAYNIAEGAPRWIQKWTEPYEEFFPKTTTSIAQPDARGNINQRWAYPALIEPSENVFALITEAGIEREHSASCLYTTETAGQYKVTADKNELTFDGDWTSPWRVIMVGTLQDIVASTLVTDVSEPSRIADTEWIQPGVVSWIYWAYNHGSKDYQIVKQYIDMAYQLGLPYVLIDWEWDVMGNGGTIDDALNYAKEKGVRVLVWYNSSTAWATEDAGGPLFRLNKAADREKEFQMLEDKGIAGVKIDFFSGDIQPMMEYCIDLLESAARHHLLVNFHGATLPRGWQRTYPNLLSTEAVYGAEWYNNTPALTTRAAAHNATLPFTRNVVGSMDYTPCTFSDSQHPHITSHAHELALTVLFESGLQHLADKPESYLAQPQAVQDFFCHLPAVWDETRLVAGYPGEYAVIARRSGKTWYVAGINGTDTPNKAIPLPIKDFISGKPRITAFADSGDKTNPWLITSPKLSLLPDSIVCEPRGGFVLVIQ